MKSLAAVVLALFLAAPGTRAQQTDTSSGSYGRRAPRKSKNSAAARIRTDAGPIGDTGTPRRAADRDHPPSLAQPTREEILEAQQRGRIRDRGVPDWVRGPQLTELDVPNPFQVKEAIKNPYRHRQDDLTP